MKSEPAISPDTSESNLLDINRKFFDAFFLMKADYKTELEKYTSKNILCFGSGAEEVCSSIEVFHDIVFGQVLKDPTDLAYEFETMQINITGSLGIITSIIKVNFTAGGVNNETVGRSTMIFERRKINWEVIHLHWSFPNFQYTETESWPFGDLKTKVEELEKLVVDRSKELELSLQNLKDTQDQLINAEKMATLGELTAGIAHEIQNPLNFVNNFSEVNSELINDMHDELAREDFDEARSIAGDIRQNLEKINHHGKRADSIIKGILQHSRKSPGTKESTDINKLADEYLRLAYHGLRAKDKTFNATLRTDFDNNIGEISVVGQDVGRVMLNLITNAFHAVLEKKKSAAEGYEPTVSVSTKKKGDKVEVRVSDNGNGVPSDILDKIFQPFFTTKPAGLGTGLGLSLSYDIIKAHDSELKMETKEGEGTTFIFDLPA
jgi:signal transduction histidine kinase